MQRLYGVAAEDVEASAPFLFIVMTTPHPPLHLSNNAPLISFCDTFSHCLICNRELHASGHTGPAWRSPEQRIIPHFTNTKPFFYGHAERAGGTAGRKKDHSLCWSHNGSKSAQLYDAGDKIRVSYASILSQVAVRRRYMRGKLPRPAQGQHHTASQFNTVMSLQQMCTLIVMNWGMFF